MKGGESGREDDEIHGESSQRHDSTAKHVGNNDTTQESKSSPPLAPIILPLRNAAAFEVKTYNTAEQINITIACDSLFQLIYGRTHGYKYNC